MIFIAILQMAKYPDRQTGQISEQMAADYERQYGRGKVSTLTDRQVRFQSRWRQTMKDSMAEDR